MRKITIEFGTRELMNAKEMGFWANAKDLFYYLLDTHSIDSLEVMAETDAGDSARNNMSLAIIENALDWKIGIFVLQMNLACIRAGKAIKKTRIQFDSKGRIYNREDKRIDN